MSSNFRRKGLETGYSIVKTAPPRQSDAVPFGTCRRCGFIAEHPTAEDCIAALRDRIAILSPKDLWKIRRHKPGPQATRPSDDEFCPGPL